MSGIALQDRTAGSNGLWVVAASLLSVLLLEASPTENRSIIVVGTVILVGSVLVMQKTNNLFDLRRPTIPGVWYLAYVGLIFLPSFGVFNSKSGPYRYTYLISVASALVMVPLGILLANALFTFKREEIRRYYDTPLQDGDESDGRMPRFMFALLLAIGLTVAWFIEQDGPIPIQYMFTHPGEAGQLATLRDASFKLLDSPIRHLYHLTRDFLYPMIILVALGNYRHSRRGIWALLFIVSLALGMMFATVNVARSPATVVILLVVLYIWISNRRFKLRAIPVGIAVALAFPVLVVATSLGDWSLTGIVAAARTVADRIFVAPASVLYYFFEVVPQHVPFLHGRGLGSLTKLVGVQYFDLGHYVGTYVLGPGGQGYSSATGAFVAELYTDFGMIGVFSGGLLTGVAMQSVHVIMMRSRKTVFSLVTYTLLIFFFATLTYLQIAGALILSGMPILFVLYRSRLFG